MLRRQETLYTKMMKVPGMKMLPQTSALRGDHPHNSEPPNTLAAYDKTRIEAASLAPPRRVEGQTEEQTVFYVESAAGGVYTQSMGAYTYTYTYTYSYSSYTYTYTYTYSYTYSSTHTYNYTYTYTYFHIHKHLHRHRHPHLQLYLYLD